MRWWRGKKAAGEHGPAGDGISPSDATPGRRSSAGSADPPTAAATIDLTDAATWAERIQPDAARAAELAERFRARAARAEALRDLQRLRARHWSAERVIEEGRTDLEWWEHPEADPYAVLGLLPGARIEEAAAARRKVAQACHPDRLEPDADADRAMRRMVAANAAYDRLRRALHPV
jgi:hypothetical protein